MATLTDTELIAQLDAELNRILSERNKINHKLNSLGVKLGPQLIDSEKWSADNSSGDTFGVEGFSDGKVVITLYEEEVTNYQRVNVITLKSLPDRVRLMNVTGPDDVYVESGPNFQYSIASIKADYADGMEYHDIETYNHSIIFTFTSKPGETISEPITMYIYSTIDDDLQGCREALENITSRGYDDVTYDSIYTYVPKGYYNDNLEVDHT